MAWVITKRELSMFESTGMNWIDLTNYTFKVRLKGHTLELDTVYHLKVQTYRSMGHILKTFYYVVESQFYLWLLDKLSKLHF